MATENDMATTNVDSESTSNLSKPDERKVTPEPWFKRTSSSKKSFEYNSMTARTPRPNANTTGESIVHMTKICLGGGVFATHIAFSKIDLFTGLITSLILVLIMDHSICMFVRSAQHMYSKVNQTQLSYSDLAEASLLLGPWEKYRKYAKCFRYFVDFILSMQLLGSCMIYQIYMAHCIKQLVEWTNLETHTVNYSVLRVYILGMIVPCVLAVFVTDLKNLASFAIVYNFYIIMIALLTVYYGVIGEIHFVNAMSTSSFFEFIGICLFSMEGHSVALLIENNMAEPKNFNYVAFGSMLFMLPMMIVIGMFGFWAFGYYAEIPITLHFSKAHFPLMTKVFLCIVMYVAYAEVFYYGFEYQRVYWKRLHLDDLSVWWLWERLYRALNVFVISLIAYLIPYACIIMEFLGCFCVPLICFIFPAFFELVLQWDNPGLGRYKWRLIRYIINTTFGSLILIIGTFYNIYEVLQWI